MLALLKEVVSKEPWCLTMEQIYLQNMRKLRRNLPILKEKLGVLFSIKGKQVTIEGTALKEYDACLVLEAMDFGFDRKEAFLLTNEAFVFRKIPIKNFTRRKNLEEVRGRIIGTEGRTKRTIENVSGCAIVVHDNAVGVIGPAERIEETTTTLTNLIRGTKQANVYRFLEKMNAARKEKSGLGLKSGKE